MVVYSRKIFLMLLDAALVNLAVFAGLYMRFEGVIPVEYLYMFVSSFWLLTTGKLIIYLLFKLYESLWQYASIEEAIQIFFATFIGAASDYLLGKLLGLSFPRSIYISSWIFSFLLVGGSRLSYRIIRRMKKRYIIRDSDQKRVMVIGAGNAGSMVIKELKNHTELSSNPVVVVDDNRYKQRFRINGVPVKGNRSKIIELSQKYAIDEIIIAIPSAPRSEIAEVLKICKKTACKLKTLPGVYELINGRVDVKDIRDVSIEDLLGRDEVRLNTEEIAGYLKDEVVLVTGGGGSIGSELCRQIARFSPKKLIILDIYENNVYELQHEMQHKYGDTLDMEVVIGSVRDVPRLNQVFSKYKPGVIFHAAAHKHVPLMEGSPMEAVKNNVLGTLNVIQCADKYGAKRFVLISTDKAVNPTNIMGATKRMAEMIVQSMDKHSKTEFVAVRFGNVLGSNGSVIPLFKKQIAHGGPVTVTHPEITRFFMTIPEASQLVIQAGAMAKGGEIFILDMGEPVKIIDLARDLIHLSGFEPDVDIKIEFTGLRPGEKLYEELLLAEEGLESTVHEKIYVGKPLEVSHREVMLCIKALENSLESVEKVRECMMKVVPTYKMPVHEEIAAAIV